MILSFLSGCLSSNKNKEKDKSAVKMVTRESSSHNNMIVRTKINEDGTSTFNAEEEFKKNPAVEWHEVPLVDLTLAEENKKNLPPVQTDGNVLIHFDSEEEFLNYDSASENVLTEPKGRDAAEDSENK